MEFNNKMIGIGTNYNTLKSVKDMINKVMRIVMTGIQQTNYPISYKAREDKDNLYEIITWRRL